MQIINDSTPADVSVDNVSVAKVLLDTCHVVCGVFFLFCTERKTKQNKT